MDIVAWVTITKFQTDSYCSKFSSLLSTPLILSYQKQIKFHRPLRTGNDLYIDTYISTYITIYTYYYYHYYYNNACLMFILCYNYYITRHSIIDYTRILYHARTSFYVKNTNEFIHQKLKYNVSIHTISV